MSTTKQISLLDELEKLLAEKIKFARQGNFNRLESLFKKTQPLAEQIAKAGILNLPEYEQHHIVLKKLYNDLNLIMSAQQEKVAQKLKEFRKTKKTLQAYES